MPKFMVEARYTASGSKGLLEKGGSARKAAVHEAVEQVGGTVECVYFAFGSDDFYSILELPDNASAAALSLVVTASGALTTKAVVLLTPEEIDEAVAKSVAFRPPGA